MKDVLHSFFKEWKIEYYSVLDYGACREINPHIIARENFAPKSVILFLIPYYAGEAENLSVYAAARDYHIFIREITAALSNKLSEIYPRASFRGYGDHSPIDERHAALISGLGILGSSGMLINEKYGTYVFIADLVSDIDAGELGVSELCEVRTCNGCGACLRACPTGILRGEGCDCLSAITQRKGELSEKEAELMVRYNTAWGCDICQSACPYNKAPEITPISFFHQDRIPRLTHEVLASLDKASFKERAFAWRGRSTVVRNLDILNNTKKG